MSIKGIFFWNFGNSKSHRYPHFFFFFFFFGFLFLGFGFSPLVPQSQRKEHFEVV
jgi:hypothetical protein